MKIRVYGMLLLCACTAADPARADLDIGNFDNAAVQGWTVNPFWNPDDVAPFGDLSSTAPGAGAFAGTLQVTSNPEQFGSVPVINFNWQGDNHPNRSTFANPNPQDHVLFLVNNDKVAFDIYLPTGGFTEPSLSAHVAIDGNTGVGTDNWGEPVTASPSVNINMVFDQWQTVQLDYLPLPAGAQNSEWSGIFIYFSGVGTTSQQTFYLDNIHLVSAAPPAQPGDFDGDGDVDGADFVVWQTNFPKATGGTLDTGDADGDGDVDGADFVVWQTNFPFTPSPGVSTVPEPATLALLLAFAIPFATYKAIARSRT